MLEQYLQIQVETATPGELVLLVYDSTIRSLEKAKLKLSKDREEDANELIYKAQNAIAELMSSVNLDVGEISNSLYSLYSFMLRHLNDAIMQKQRKCIDDVINLLNNLKGAWEEIVRREPNGSIIQAHGNA